VFRQWLAKLRLTLLYNLSQFFAIKPPFRVNPNEYCPACGAEEGTIRAAVLDKPDNGGSKIAILHTCKVDGYQWLEASATVIKDHIMPEPRLDDPEQEAIRQMSRDKRTKSSRVTETRVNGELVS